MYHMKNITVRDLRYDFPKVERLLRKGQAVQVTKRGKVIARLEPEGESVLRRPPLPDFQARMRANFGDKMLEPSGADLISAERDERP